jgi:hypothetical protein
VSVRTGRLAGGVVEAGVAVGAGVGVGVGVGFGVAVGLGDFVADITATVPPPTAAALVEAIGGSDVVEPPEHAVIASVLRAAKIQVRFIPQVVVGH